MATGVTAALHSREDHALKLYEAGISTSAIAERLGVKRPSVNRMIHAARKRRVANNASSASPENLTDKAHEWPRNSF